MQERGEGLCERELIAPATVLLSIIPSNTAMRALFLVKNVTQVWGFLRLMGPSAPAHRRLGQNGHLGIRIDLLPARVRPKSGYQWGIRREDYGADSPGLHGMPPIVGQVITCGEIVHEGIPVKIGPAVYVNAILGIQLPDEVAAPVVVVQERTRRPLFGKKRYCDCREFMGFG